VLETGRVHRGARLEQGELVLQELVLADLPDLVAALRQRVERVVHRRVGLGVGEGDRRGVHVEVRRRRALRDLLPRLAILALGDLREHVLLASVPEAVARAQDLLLPADDQRRGLPVPRGLVAEQVHPRQLRPHVELAAGEGNRLRGDEGERRLHLAALVKERRAVRLDHRRDRAVEARHVAGERDLRQEPRVEGAVAEARRIASAARRLRGEPLTLRHRDDLSERERTGGCGRDRGVLRRKRSTGEGGGRDERADRGGCSHGHHS
jgi:hypothetical protein